MQIVPLHGSKFVFDSAIYASLFCMVYRSREKKQTNIHIAARAFLRYEGQLLSACFVLILSILSFRVTSSLPFLLRFSLNLRRNLTFLNVLAR